jgi:hypothetical protein
LARVLTHEQYHFEIACVMAGRGSAALQVSSPSPAEDIRHTVETKTRSLSNQYDTATDHGCIAAKQAAWQTDIDGGLPTTKVPQAGIRAAVTLVSCIMPTADRRHFVPEAIRLFLAQDHAERGLVILDDGADAVAPVAGSTFNLGSVNLMVVSQRSALRRRLQSTVWRASGRMPLRG